MPGRIRLSLLLVIAAVSLSVALPTAQTRTPHGAAPALTLDTVARDWDQFVGMAPAQFRWSPDGKALHFDWNPERAENFWFAVWNSAPR